MQLLIGRSLLTSEPSQSDPPSFWTSSSIILLILQCSACLLMLGFSGESTEETFPVYTKIVSLFRTSHFWFTELNTVHTLKMLCVGGSSPSFQICRRETDSVQCSSKTRLRDFFHHLSNALLYYCCCFAREQNDAFHRQCRRHRITAYES